MSFFRKQRNILGFLLVFGPAAFLVFIATRGCSHNFKNLDVLAKLPSYEFTDASGKKRSSKEFKDEVILITTLQKSCPYECAVSFWHVNQILYQHLRKNSHKQLKKVRIISFVTDGKGNPASNIQDLQETLSSQVEGYQPDLWILAQ
ncbi:MAG: hypothetical protein RLZZ68_737, partial [Bacteroidota bacterium]